MATCEGNHVSERIRQACEGGKALIEIKRNCSSSIRNDPVKQQITFGNFTIKITEEEWQQFDIVLQDCKLSPVEALEELIYASLDLYNTKICKQPNRETTSDAEEAYYGWNVE